MMLRVRVAWRSLCHNRRQALALFLLSGCAMALLLTAAFLGDGLRSGLISAVEPFDLLVGSGGSYQMVVNTVFLQDYPSGNVPYELVEKLRGDARVAAAAPLAFGDNYRGYRLVGTERELFRLPAAGREAWLRLDSGRIFSDSGREAVLGARAARELGLKLGDEIYSAHGLIEDEKAERHASYRVCGILKPCRGPYDRAIFVPLTAVWAGHGIKEDDSEDEDGHDEEDEHVHRRETTAIMVKPAGYAEAYQLFVDFPRGQGAEMVFPSQVAARLLSILGQAEWVFKAVGGAAGLLAAAIVFLVLYWSVCARADELRILGLLGVEKGDRMLMVLLEGLFVVVPGIVAGFMVGRLVLFGLADVIGDRTGLTVASGAAPFDAALAAMLAAAGLLGGILGGWRVMRE
ncbi:MAG: ABC transporter permease [Planctomycetota bacterium]|jgi:putative ABC transport system permease protein|nr:ABC transporter permease [Planctomycetota bacterium]